MIGQLLYILGISKPGYWQNFWEGFGSGPIAWCWVPIGYYAHHICHERGCYRWGHPGHDGGVKCRKHL